MEWGFRANVCMICEEKICKFQIRFSLVFLTFVAANINYNIFKSL